MNKYNEQSFVPEEVEQDLHLDLLKTLLDYNKKSKKYYNDIHITTDGYCVIVEWVNVPHEHHYGGQFRYVDEDEVVMIECKMPDNTYRYFRNEEEYKEELREFLKEHSQYKEKE